MDSIRNEIFDSTDMKYRNMKDLLKEKESLIETSKTEIGKVNKEDLTVPITFTLTPKEVSPDTRVSLVFEGKSFPMEKKGIEFKVRVDRDIFSDALPTIVVDREGNKRTMDGEEIGIRDIKDKIFPISRHNFLLGQAIIMGSTS